MSQNTTEKSIEALAGEYFAAQEQEADQEKLEEAREHLSELQDRYERFKQEYGESDPATQELSERVADAEERVEELEEAQQIPEELEEQILEVATGFMLTEEWLNADAIEALNQALTGDRNSTLVIEEIGISGLDDVDDLDDITRFDVIDVVRKLAMDKLGESEAMKEVWDSIEGTTKETPFRIAASRGYADPDEIIEVIDGDDDVDRETIRNRLKNTVRQLDVNPYDRQDGVYHLATAGKYITTRYVDLTDDFQVSAIDSAEQEGDDQTTLNQKTAGEGGDSDD